MPQLRPLAAVLLGCASTALFAQPQHTQWYFGFGAGLDLSTTPATPTPGPLSTDEGCASVCDANGQLLFFTNGENVWDRNQNVMPNGWGLFGHFSSSQSGLIVPMPDDPDRYLIFTTPSEAGVWSGQSNAAYSLVDMTQNNGLGDVLVKNVVLTGPVTEKLTAVRHRNGKDVWVVYHRWATNEYLAYLVSCDGVHGPVVSALGYTPGPDAQGGTIAAIGCMRLDRQGDRLAAVYTHPVVSTQQVFQSQVIVDLMDFDDMTGMLTNPRSDTIHSGNENIQGYGVEFSASGRFLYVSDNGLVNGISTSNIHQYDTQAPDPIATRTLVGGGNPAHGTLQLAPDGRILMARLNGATYLASINQPDNAGAASGYVSNAVSLGGVASTWGLPNHWDTYPLPAPGDPIALTDTLVCDAPGGVVLDAMWQHPFHVPVYLWSTGATTSSITVNESGTYWVEVQLPCTTLTDTVDVRIGGMPVDLGPDLSLCEGGEVLLAVDDAAASILWSTGETGPGILVREPGNYAVTVTDSLGCVMSDAMTLVIRNCSCPLHLPNAFTPNGDGINDVFGPVFDCDLLDYRFTLFDRWGSEIFTSTRPEIAWDGTGDAPADVPTVHPWQLEYMWHDGETLRHARRTGHVTVVR